LDVIATVWCSGPRTVRSYLEITHFVHFLTVNKRFTLGSSSSAKKSKSTITIAGKEEEQKMNVWLRLLENNKFFGFVELDVEVSGQISISEILNAVKHRYKEDLHGVSTFHVYSGLDNQLLLDGNMNWNLESHGGDRKNKALLVKFARPVVTNQEIRTCGFLYR